MTEAQPGTWRRVAVVHNLLDLVWDEPLSVGEAASLAASDLPEAVAEWKGAGDGRRSMRAAIGHGWTMELSESGSGARRRMAGFGRAAEGSLRSEPAPTFNVLGVDWDLEAEAVFFADGRDSPAPDLPSPLAAMSIGADVGPDVQFPGSSASSPGIAIPGSPVAEPAGNRGRDSPTWGGGGIAQSPSLGGTPLVGSGPDVRLTFRPWSLAFMSSNAGSPGGSGSGSHQLVRGSPGSRGSRGRSSRGSGGGGGGVYIFKVFHLLPGGASTPALQEPTGSVPARGARLRSSFAPELLAHRRLKPGASHKVLLLAELQATTAQMLEMRGL